MKVSELTGAALDWAVAMAEGWTASAEQDAKGEYLWLRKNARGMNPKHYHPSTHWGIGGPIIERAGIGVFPLGDGRGWAAGLQDGPTPLIAAMRCYVASKLGDEIDVPKEIK